MEAAEVVELPGKVAVGCSAYVFPTKLGKYVSDSFYHIAGHLRELGVDSRGSHYTRYLLFTPLAIRVEVGIELADGTHVAPESLPSSLRMLELPACKAAAVWHIGPYEKLPSTYMSLCGWIKEQGLRCGSLCFEEYHTNPEKETDKEQYKTRVFWEVSERAALSSGWGLWT